MPIFNVVLRGPRGLMFSQYRDKHIYSKSGGAASRTKRKESLRVIVQASGTDSTKHP